jgi:hypothetical protein
MPSSARNNPESEAASCAPAKYGLNLHPCICPKAWRATSGRRHPGGRADGRTPLRAAGRGALYYGWEYMPMLRGKGGCGGGSRPQRGGREDASTISGWIFRFKRPSGFCHSAVGVGGSPRNTRNGHGVLSGLGDVSCLSGSLGRVLACGVLTGGL